MNKKNLLILVVIGLNILFGLFWVVVGIIGGDFATEEKMKHIASVIAFGSFVGAGIMLWQIKELILGRSILGLIVFVVVLVLLFFAALKSSIICAFILLGLELICALKAFLGLKKGDEE